ncbi:MAG: hypothetical protein GYB67_02145 [Chloroflexi bacterium]|nr:hypothetical protein [Chloroflexota bacterium]
MAVTATPKPITMDDVRAADGLDEDKGLEIVAGVWTPRHVAGDASIGHGKYGALLIRRLGDVVETHQLGEVYMSETIFVLHVDAKDVRTIRKPDIAFASNAHVNPAVSEL